jgi:hypothetical protein
VGGEGGTQEQPARQLSTAACALVRSPLCWRCPLLKTPAALHFSTLRSGATGCGAKPPCIIFPHGRRSLRGLRLSCCVVYLDRPTKHWPGVKSKAKRVCARNAWLPEMRGRQSAGSRQLLPS